MNPVSMYASRLLRTWKRSMVQLKGGSPTLTVTVKANANVFRGPQKVLNKLTTEERRYLAGVKSLPCGVCGAAGPSDAHHIEQHKQFLCIPLCKDCHQGSFNGIHGQQRIWKVYKKTEMSVLNDTIRKLFQCK